MAGRSRNAPRAGMTRHRDPRVRDIKATCGCCFAIMSIPVDHTMPVRDQLRDESCLFCGRLGQLVLTKEAVCSA